MASGDDTGFRPLPGDPWEPKPSSEPDPAVTEEQAPEAAEGSTGVPGRRLFGRRRRRQDEGDASASEDLAATADVKSPPPAEQAVGVDPPADDPTLTIDLPPWAEGGTSGAEEVEAGFATDDDVVHLDPAGGRLAYMPPTVLPGEVTRASEEPSEMGSGPELATPPSGGLVVPLPFGDVTAEEVPTSTVEAVLAESVEGVPGDVEEASPVAEGFRVESAEPAALEEEEIPVAAIDASDEPPAGERRSDSDLAAPGPYGVAGPEAFAALHDDELGDLDDWAAFAGEATSVPEPSTEAEVLDVEDSPEPPPRARRRLFGRRARPAEAEESFDGEEDPYREAGARDGSVPDGEELEGEDIEAVADQEEVVVPRRGGLFRRRRIVAEAPHADDEPGADWDEGRSPGDLGGESWPEAARVEPGAEMAGVGGDAIFRPPADGEAVDDEYQESAMSEPDDSEWFDEEPEGAPKVTDSAREEQGGADAWGAEPVAVDPDRTMELSDPVGASMADDPHVRAATVEHRDLAEEIHRLGEQETEWQAMAAVMPGVESGVVGFEDVADLSTGEGYREGPRSDLAARFATGLVLAVFLFGSLFVGGAAMAVFVGILAVVGMGELFATLRRVGFRPLTPVGILAGVGVLATTWFHGPIAIAIGIGLLSCVVFFVLAFGPLREDALVNGGLTVVAVVWVVGTMAFATPILRHPDFRTLVLALVLATAAMDMGAFTFGRAWGRRALAPVLSPNKSVEGLVGGVIAAVGVGAAFGAFYEPFDLRSGLGLGVLVAVMAPLGDLAESMVKRSLGVKDMGTMLPGHGGILDRVDAFLFVVPAVWVLYRSIGLLG